MKNNARYTGGSGTGVDLIVPLVDGQQRRVHIAQGEPLPENFGGVAIDPEFLERLLETPDWDAVDETAEQRKARLQAEKDQLELDEAAAAAAAEHQAAAEKAAAAAAAAEQKAAGHRDAAEQAAAAASSA